MCPAASPGHVALPMNIMSTGDPALTVTCPVRQGIHFSENYFVAAATLFWSLSTYCSFIFSVYLRFRMEIGSFVLNLIISSVYFYYTGCHQLIIVCKAPLVANW